jgi:anti-anti-sigma factor
MRPWLNKRASVGARRAFCIRRQTRDRRHRVLVSGEIDMRTAPELEAVLGSICVDASEIEVDLCDVTFIDSAGLRALLTAKAICAEHYTELMFVPSERRPQRRALEPRAFADLRPW